ncbi:MAG: CehA/McbA family metallohydrolase [Planctomycetota bacterium]
MQNPAGHVGRLRVASPNAGQMANTSAKTAEARWLDLQLLSSRPMNPNLSGLGLEYRVIQIYARAAGEYRGDVSFSFEREVGSGPQASGARLAFWDFDGDPGIPAREVDGWFPMHGCELKRGDNVLAVDAIAEDPYFGVQLNVEAGPFILRFAANVPAEALGQVFWWTEEKPRPDGDRLRSWQQTSGQGFQEHEIRFETKSELLGIRIDPTHYPGKYEFDWIALYREGAATSEEASYTHAFEVEHARAVTLSVRDEKGDPCIAAFTIRDERGRVYPAPGKRLAPDFFFHSQVYRGDGEVVRLPDGSYTIECSRGPESIPETRSLEVSGDTRFAYRVKRWIDPAASSWISGDHHIHAAGCLHYSDPTQGVLPQDMARHIMGEDLKVGAALTWGPCFDYQKQFFSGQIDAASKLPYLLRYDIEVSGFGSHQSGHLCLLRLKDQMYPGGTSKHHWPTLGMNTLRWAKKQGAICGPAHSAIGITRGTGRRVEGRDGPGALPTFEIPRFDGIGANEFIVDIAHNVPGPDGKPVPAVDFISTMDTNRKAELNIWYHSLNVGFRVRASGETDFPCITGERVGLGRVYVKLAGDVSYDAWCEGIGAGRSYVSDGKGHLLDFMASGGGRSVAVGENGSELRLSQAGSVKLNVRAAARLPEETTKVEVIVNSYPVASREIRADGSESVLTFDVPITQSSWVALRVFPHAHTNPIFVVVDGESIRASKASAEWCLESVNQCWSQKERTYAENERSQARKDYEHARQVYRKRIAESVR